MAVETVATTDHTPMPWSCLLNPLWWLASTGDATLSFTAPAINNGAPYLPGTTNQFLRNVMWWFRNPAGNFVGFVLGLDGVNYKVTGTAPALATTGRDCTPTQGFRWAILLPPFSLTGLLVVLAFLALGLFIYSPFMLAAYFGVLRLIGCPYISYYKSGLVEFYLGWRPSSGGLGAKLVKGRPPGYAGLG